jgi:hypothetical protein
MPCQQRWLRDHAAGAGEPGVLRMQRPPQRRCARRPRRAVATTSRIPSRLLTHGGLSLRLAQFIGGRSPSAADLWNPGTRQCGSENGCSRGRSRCRGGVCGGCAPIRLGGSLALPGAVDLPCETRPFQVRTRRGAGSCLECVHAWLAEVVRAGEIVHVVATWRGIAQELGMWLPHGGFAPVKTSMWLQHGGGVHKH